MYYGYRFWIYGIAFMWVGEVLRRLPKDIEHFKNSDHPADKAIPIIIWAITLALIVGMGVWAKDFFSAIYGLIKAMF